MRKNVTLDAAALSALEVTKTRPRLKPAQSVLVSLGARTVATTYWPGALAVPNAGRP